jgi:small subunit ribosomal protein S5
MNNKSDNKSQRRDGGDRKPKEFEQYILDMARVTRVTEGGKHMSFRICILLGDRRGRVGYGIAKGTDVQIGVEKAVHQAKKNIITIPLINDTIPHQVVKKFKSALVMLKPAPRGSGIIAGGAVRAVLDLAGVPNVSSKNLGKTKNKIMTVRATFEALKSFKSFSRGKKQSIAKSEKRAVEGVAPSAAK